MAIEEEQHHHREDIHHHRHVRHAGLLCHLRLTAHAELRIEEGRDTHQNGETAHVITVDGAEHRDVLFPTYNILNEVVLKDLFYQVHYDDN